MRKTLVVDSDIIEEHKRFEELEAKINDCCCELIEDEKETFYLKNDILSKTHHVKNYRTQIRNQLPRKIRID